MLNTKMNIANKKIFFTDIKSLKDVKQYPFYLSKPIKQNTDKPACSYKEVETNPVAHI